MAPEKRSALAFPVKAPINNPHRKGLCLRYPRRRCGLYGRQKSRLQRLSYGQYFFSFRQNQIQ